MPKPSIDTSQLDSDIADLTTQLQAVNGAVSQLAARVTALEMRAERASQPPLYDKWKADIPAFGDIHAAKFFDAALNGAERLDLCYYDAAWIYANLAAYFQRPDYLKVRDEAIKIYRDGYVMAQPTPGKVAGWMIFPHGLSRHYLDTKDEQSKAALLAMADNAAFASVGEITNYLPHEVYSREAAYTLMCKLYARDLGATPVGIEEATGICLGHLAQWRAILDGTNTDLQWIEPNGVRDDCRCFMVGLTCQALIEYASRTPSPAIKTAITDTLNLLWDKMYLPASQSMKYTDREIPGVGNTDPSPDVNMLIAPAYAWIGQRDRADALFEGSVTGAYLTGDKQFNQAARWVWDYFTWRNS